MANARQIFRKIHLWVAVPTGIFFSILCFTGAILIWAPSPKRPGGPNHGGGRPPVEATQTRNAEPQTNNSETRPPKSAVRDSTLLATEHTQRRGEDGMSNPNRPDKATAAAPQQGRGQEPKADFFMTVRKLHRWLGASYRRGQTEFSLGKFVTGCVTLLSLLVLISGIVLFFPAHNSNRWKISFNKGFARFCHDLHVAGGMYVVIFLLIMSITGLTWSFGWWRSMIYSLGDDQSLRGLIYQLHTGKIGGLTTQIIWFVCCIIGGTLPLTGYYMWWRRIRQRRAKRGTS